MFICGLLHGKSLRVGRTPPCFGDIWAASKGGIRCEKISADLPVSSPRSTSGMGVLRGDGSSARGWEFSHALAANNCISFTAVQAHEEEEGGESEPAAPRVAIGQYPRVSTPSADRRPVATAGDVAAHLSVGR